MAEINPTAINPFNRANPNTPQPPAASGDTSESTVGFWGEDGFTFGDILDLINPLQHLPFVGAFYRSITGDEISTGSSILGGGLFGGVIGAGVAVANSIIEEVTGAEIVEHMVALFDDEEQPAAPTVLASAENRFGSGAAFSHRAQESAGDDFAAPESPPARARVERDYAFNYAFGRSAQEATMTSVAPHDRAPADPAPVFAVATESEPVIRTAMMATPAWLSATPRIDTAALRSTTPQAGYQLIQAVERYNQQAMAAKAMAARPAIIDSLY